jgi:uncharacterized protein
MAQFRILSLDGGGSWALIQVRALTAIFERVLRKGAADITGHEVLKHFDFAAANSGGTLTLAGLLHDWPLSTLLDLFNEEKNRRKIFAPTNAWHRRAFRAIAGIGPIYSTARKREGLRVIMEKNGRRELAELPELVGLNYAGRFPQFLFCAHNYDTQRAAFMRSDSESRAASSARREGLTLLDAVHASANPPVNFFDRPAECGKVGESAKYWDGAIAGHNNPVMAAVIEALANSDRYAASRADIWALSIGTGTTTLPLDREKKKSALYIELERPWLFADVKKLALSIMGDPPDVATFNAHMLLDGALPAHDTPGLSPSPIVRMNPLIQPLPNGKGGWILPPGYDTPEEFWALRKLDMDGVSEKDVAIIDTFCDRWMADTIPNQPVRANMRTFTAEIGHRKFSQALNEVVARLTAKLVQPPV